MRPTNASIAQARRPNKHRTNAATRQQARKFWAMFYAEPDPLSGEAEAARFTHADLQHLSDADLAREAGRLRLRLLLDNGPSSWLREREFQIGLEQLRRHAESPS